MPLYIPGSALQSQVLIGVTFSAGTKYNVVGTMPLKTASNGDGGGTNHHLAKETSGVPGTIYLRPVNPTDPITAFQGDVWIRKDDANFNPAYWRSDVSMFGLQGTMPNRSAQNIHMPANAFTVWSGDRVFLQPPPGYYDGSTWVTGAAAGLVASNIRNGVNILGLTGTMIEGKRSASGSVASPGASFSVNGLAFDPYVVVISLYDSTLGDYTVFTGIDGEWHSTTLTAPGGSFKYGGYSKEAWTTSGFTLGNTVGTHTVTWQAWEK
ncbi:hypothetical protein [Paenibacillus sp. sgz500992]|uniref:hypothetical protein n=1 Tax=Paenibacillus sp. sgz500992 TaxID=3242476 RepID=UPI0036D2C602